VSVVSSGVILLWAQNPGIAILEKIAAEYRSAVPFKVGFSVRQEIPGSGTIAENRAIFYLGTDERFRVDFPEQEIVWDGEWLWTRDPANHQVIVEEFNPRSSLKFILDILNGSLSGFQVVKTNPSADLTDITLKPKKSDGYITSMRLKIDDRSLRIRRADYYDFQNNMVTIEFDSLMRMSPYDSVLFGIDLKKNEELIDLRP